MKKLVAFYILVFVPSIIHSQLSTQLLLQTLQQNPSLLLSNPELLRRVISATQQPQPQPQLVPQPRRDECSAIKKQNKLLRQMLSSVTGPGVLNDLDFNESIKSQQVVNPVQALLNQVQQAPEPPRPSNAYMCVKASEVKAEILYSIRVRWEAGILKTQNMI